MSASASLASRMTGVSPQASSARRRHPLAGPVRLAEAGQQARHVAERHQVAAGADGAALGDDGKDVAVHAVDEQPDHLQPDARIAAREAVRADQHRGPHRRGIGVGAAAVEVVQHQVRLQGDRLLGTDLTVGAVAETGGHAVDRLPGPDQRMLQRVGLLDTRAGLRRQFDGRATGPAGMARHLRHRERIDAQPNHAGIRLRSWPQGDVQAPADPAAVSRVICQSAALPIASVGRLRPKL